MGSCECDSFEIVQSHESLHYDQRGLMQLDQLHAMVLKSAERMQSIHVLKGQRHAIVPTPSRTAAPCTRRTCSPPTLLHPCWRNLYGNANT